MLRALAALSLLAGLSLAPRAASAADAFPSGPVTAPAVLEEDLAFLAKTPATVVAEVDGKPVTYAEVADAIRTLPRINAEATFPQVFRAAANLVITRKALAAKLERSGLAALPVVQHRVQDAQDRVLGEELLRRSLAPNLLEPAVKSTYDATPVSKDDVTEVQLRIIAVATQAAAEDAIQHLKAGADFATLARATSLDSSAANGGLLDWHWRSAMAPELAAVGFAMNPGDTTAYPLRSGGQWLVVRTEARRTRPPLTFAEARHEVEQDINRIGMAELRTLAMKQSSISYYGLTGKPAAPAAQK